MRIITASHWTSFLLLDGYPTYTKFYNDASNYVQFNGAGLTYNTSTYRVASGNYSSISEYAGGKLLYTITGGPWAGPAFSTHVLTVNNAAVSTVLFGGADSIVGSRFNDYLLGYAGNDILRGGAGNDTLNGGAGNNNLLGEAGNDYIAGGAGFDTLNGGDGNDILVGGAGRAIFSGGAGIDYALFDLRTATAAVAFNGIQLTLGGAGKYNLSGVERFSVKSGAGNDLLYGGAYADVFESNNGNDRVFAGDGNDTILGGAGNDFLSGQAGNDSLVGGTGNDTLDGGAGNDRLVGGAGNNVYYVDSALDTIVDGGAGFGVDTVFASATISLASFQFSNLENLTLTGSAAINGTGNSINNVITGNSAANILSGGNSGDTLYGVGGNDTLNGDSANDTLYGGDGADSLNGGDGEDVLDGGAGADTLAGGTYNDIYYLGAGDIVVEGVNEGIDKAFASVTVTLDPGIEILVLTGTSAIDATSNEQDYTHIFGNSAANHLYGRSGADYLVGGAGGDTLEGGIGADRYFVDDLSDVLIESPNSGEDFVLSNVDWVLGDDFEHLTLGAKVESDVAHTSYQGDVLQSVWTGGSRDIDGTGNAKNNFIIGSFGANLLDGKAGNDYIQGYSGADTLLGGDGNDEIGGGNGADSLDGGAGSDLLDGDSTPFDLVAVNYGADTLTGGAGADTFSFTTAIGVGANGILNVDTITDFSVVDDRIQLLGSVFAGVGISGTLSASRFATDAPADADDRIIYNSSTGSLYYDADGNGAGAAIEFARLTAGLALTNADFVIP